MKTEDLLRYDITVHLPKKAHTSDPPLQLNKFHANLTSFQYMVGDLASDVKFEEFEIESDMVPVTVDVSGQLSCTRILLSSR